MNVAVHQFLPNFAGGDAVGRHTLAAQRILREAGFESEIYAGEAHREVAKACKPYRSFSPRAGSPTWLLYQFSTGSPVGGWVANRPEPLILNYHNVTPAGIIAPWEPSVGVELVAGRQQLAELAPIAVAGIGVSSYNTAELIDLGCPRAVVAPVLVDLDEYHASPDAKQLAALERAKANGGADWLFVGRLAANKAQHDIISAFAAYVRHIDPKARLHLVGGSSSHRYETALHDYVRALGLGDQVDFTSKVDFPQLLAYYAAADVFVCLSDHEGFCVPILEAMELGVPVVAFRSTAIPETVAGGGLLLPSKDAGSVAVAVERVVNDLALRARLVTAGRRRAGELSLGHSRAAFLDAVRSIVSGES